MAIWPYRHALYKTTAMVKMPWPFYGRALLGAQPYQLPVYGHDPGRIPINKRVTNHDRIAAVNRKPMSATRASRADVVSGHLRPDTTLPAKRARRLYCPHCSYSFAMRIASVTYGHTFIVAVVRVMMAIPPSPGTIIARPGFPKSGHWHPTRAAV